MTLKQIREMEQRGRRRRQQQVMNPNRAEILQSTGRELPTHEPRSIAQVLSGEKAQAAFGKLREAAK